MKCVYSTQIMANPSYFGENNRKNNPLIMLFSIVQEMVLLLL